MFNTNLTLGDIARLDQDNFQHLDEKEHEDFQFETLATARQFQAKCFDKTIRRLGIKIKPGMSPERIERLFKSREVRVETRIYHPDDGGSEVYYDGIYIYKGDLESQEIVAFISNPFIRKKKIINLTPRFIIRTNVKGVY